MTMPNKYCRICWNTAGWRMPTGDAARIETGKTYVVTHGFGHEEWIFNFEWLINGFRYGFLQPIGKFYEAYRGQSCSILLYTVTPELETLLVGKIDNIYVPDRNELDKVLKISTKKGWIEDMRAAVDHVGGDKMELEDPPSTSIANVRFRPEDVEIYDPRQRVIGKHKIAQVPRRYHPFDWVNDYPTIEVQPPRFRKADPRRSEKERTRAAQEAGTVDPRHIRLQNRLYTHLCKIHGRENVRYEQDYVDLSIEDSKGITFFEIKMETTAKRCIRAALGQLIEYAHYPKNNRAKRLVVVGDAPPSENDRSYMAFLRKKYHLPIFYSRFLWDSDELSEEI